MDSTAFRAALEAGEVIVLDGGLATQLEAQGADLADALWSARLLVEDPAAIVGAHLAYYGAGARVATTASYQATFEGFARRGLGREEAAALMRASVALAAEARAIVVAERPGKAPPLFVAASVGPYGAMLADGSEYRGRHGRTVAQLRDFHRDRLAVLASTDADVLAVETIPELEEAVAVADLLADADGAAAWIAFSCRDGARLNSGVPIEEAVAAIDGRQGVLALGVNCTPPEHLDELTARIAAVSTLPVVVYPNSGEGWDAVRKAWTGAAAGRVDALAGRRWVASGARLVGGCCRVTPEQVRQLAEGLPAHA
ncbi:MAG TPA: homocysteine S-methyltransferase [Candidatus Limnocylindrales bacterium]|nr:homocysteine S-methyltransferase [Candidatus Limnocylindrales bacterium]